CPESRSRWLSSRKGSIASLERFHRRAGAEEVAIAVDTVNPRDRWPEFLSARPGRRISGLLARIRMVPVVSRHLFCGMRRVFQKIVFAVGLARADRVDFGADRDHRLAKTVQFVF